MRSTPAGTEILIEPSQFVKPNIHLTVQHDNVF